jgi:radical SAM protein with 4Fe4S-binding SPASM domain
MQRLTTPKKYFALCPEVYLVEGYSKHCFYDLANGNLYSINDDAKNFVRDLIQGGTIFDNLTADQQEFLGSLNDNKLLRRMEKPGKLPNITDLINEYFLEFAWVEVTRKCNNNCHFCYAKSSSKCSNTMNVGDFFTVRDELEKIGVKRIQFIGGEPLLLGEDLKKMITSCGENFTFIEIFSNGTLIDDKWCEFFKKYNLHIALSVHSYLPEEHDRTTRTKGSHARTTQAISLLQKYEIKYRLATIKTAQCNVGEKPENCFYDLHTSNVRLVGRGNIDQYDFDMFKSKAITKRTMTKKLYQNTIRKNVSGHKCFLKNLYIASNLDVFPCVMERRFKHGNLRKNGLDKIIKQNIRTLNKDKIEGCMDCEYRYACYDCRPDSNGNGKYAKPWYCTYDPYSGLGRSH